MNRIHQVITTLISHPGFKRYFANASWLFLEQILRLLVGLAIGVLVARYLGPEQFGMMNYVLAFVAIFSPIARFGLDKLLIREMLANKHKINEQLGTAYVLRLIGACVSLCLIALACVLSSQNYQTFIYIMIVGSSLLFQAFEVTDLYFQSQVQAKNIAFSKVAQLIVATGLKLLFIYIQAPLIWFICIFLIEQIVLVVALLWRYFRYQNPNFLNGFNISLFYGYIKLCWPIILAGLVLMIQTRVDHVMLKEMLGDSSLGYYSAANRLIEALWFIPGLLVNSLFPAIVNSKKLSKLQYEWRLYNLYRMMMVVSLLVVFPLFLWGDHIILLLYGNSYLPAGSLFALMSFRVFLMNYDVVRNAYLVAENKVLYSFLSAGLGAFINVALNLYWIPKYQAMGAVSATLVSFFITTFVIDLFHRDVRANLFNMYKSFLLINSRKSN